MNDLIYKRALREQIQKKFYGHDTLKSKAAPRYAQNAERQYTHLLQEVYTNIEKQLQKALPTLLKSIKHPQSLRTDSEDDFEQKLHQTLQQIIDRLGEEILLHHIAQMLIQITSVTRRTVNEQWFAAVQKTLGVDVLKDYYNGDFYALILQEWLSDNLDLIKTIPQDVIHGMEDKIMDRYLAGGTAREIAKDIRDTCHVSKGRARFIARDQIGKLQSKMTQYQQEDAGVAEYIWSANRDSKTRPQHRFLDGKKFRWDSPPISDPKRGRRCHPGEDYGCRCVALPVFNLNVMLPWEKQEQQAEQRRIQAGIAKEDDYRWKYWNNKN